MNATRSLIILVVLLAGVLISAARVTATVAGPLMALPTVLPDPVQAADARASAYDYHAGNAGWNPVARDFDGVTMVLVPPGCFMMGTTAEQAQWVISELGVQAHWVEDEQPAREQCFDQPFWIDQTEVTQADFARLGGRKARANRFAGGQRPVESITWFEAREFCALRGSRLPTEREWEYAARGPDNWMYPWGDRWNEDNVVWARNSNDETGAVGSRPAGASWVGALDMSGNVWEWVSSLYLPYDGVQDSEADTGDRTDSRRVLRGGSWNADFASSLRAADRTGAKVTNAFDFFGLRCARSADLHAITGIARNAGWTPVTRDFDGMTMVLVPPGCFLMGTDAAEIARLNAEFGTDWFNNAAPQHEQCFDTPFWIDQTEVTQADFARLGGRKAEANRFTGGQRPVESITWFEARDFCALRGARLPAEREWEYAARGPDGLLYPWGREWTENSAVWSGSGNGQTASVGSLPAGRSWVGAVDMSGNVWEWTNSLLEPYPYDEADGREEDTGNRTDILRVFRGGSWSVVISSYLRASFRNAVAPDFRDYNGGFRCARSAQASDSG